jgi:hypothetical protein
METRTLGRNGLVVSAIGYGCMGLERVYDPATDRQEGVPRGRLSLLNLRGISRRPAFDQSLLSKIHAHRHLENAAG